MHAALKSSCWIIAGFVVPALGRAAADADVPAFIDRHCSSCHNDVDKEAGLDLASLRLAPAEPGNFQLWVKVHDRVANGEMPPKEKKRPAAAELAGFVQGVGSALTAAERTQIAREGRATQRRLNSIEYQNALRDLLGAPWLQVTDQLPEDGEAHKFNKVTDALDVSHVHMSRYMMAADYALRQAMSVAFVRPPTTTTRYFARDAFYTGPTNGEVDPERQKFPVVGTIAQPLVRAARVPQSDPATRETEATGWISSTYVTGFNSVWDIFNAPVAGRYRLRFSGYSLWVGTWGFRKRFEGIGASKRRINLYPEWHRPNFDEVTPGRRDEAITVYAFGATNRRVGGFDVTPEPSVSEVNDVWLRAGDRIVTDASRFFRSRPTGVRPSYTNPLAQRDGMPAVAFRWMEVEGPLYDDVSGSGYRLLFGDLPMKQVEAGTAGVTLDIAPAGTAARGRGRGRGAAAPRTMVEVVANQPEQEAERLLRAFMQRAYRRPVEEKHVQLFLRIIRARFSAGLGFANSMLAGYTAVLSSPGFVYVDEKPGPLDDHALATRLALFLWNSEPDEALRARAARGELQRPEALRAEVDRLLADPKARRFVDAFLDYWLELRRIDDTTPSTALYNDYYLDDALAEAAVEESRLFFAELLRGDLPARNVVDSDFTFLNERLALHYTIPGVAGIAMRRVALPAESPRGGLMTQASVLKVTANGTTTSPVLRGKWISERIMGFELPPPPASVPAVDPDIRGAVTIRQQLEKHRADESCAACHRKIDPPGHALESFDVMGGWRDRYRATSKIATPEVGVGKNGWPYMFHYALPVDPSGELADGRAFGDVRDLKHLLLADETQIARNLARQLTVYATGAPVRFSDRETIERILTATKAKGYGVRSLVHALVQSELFRNK